MIIFCPKGDNSSIMFRHLESNTGSQCKGDFNEVVIDHQRGYCHTVLFLKKENTEPSKSPGRLQKYRAPGSTDLLSWNVEGCFHMQENFTKPVGGWPILAGL